MWNSQDIIIATGGKLVGKQFVAESVAIDSRKLEKNALFIAIKGEVFDGHDFVAAAFVNAAVAAIVEKIPDDCPPNAIFIVVGDSFKALQDLAAFARKRSSAKIIAITGSVGKTGTKELTSKLLGNCYASKGNFNNHYGLPLSLVNLPQDAEFAVFELGMNHAGELADLSKLLRPHIGVITNIAAVHLEFFENLKAIAKAKSEIIEGIEPGGILILNRDGEFFDYLVAKAGAKDLKVITFGEHADTDYRLLEYSNQGENSQIKISYQSKQKTFILGTSGRHWSLVLLAALAAAQAACGEILQVDLSDFHEPQGRGKSETIAGITIIDDCYNASPISMQAAIEKLGEFEGGRKIAVLGDMLELGATSQALHENLFADLISNKIDKLYAAGHFMHSLFELVPGDLQGGYAKNASELAQIIVGDLQKGDVILIKGSRGSRMDIVRDKIKEKLNAL